MEILPVLPLGDCSILLSYGGMSRRAKRRWWPPLGKQLQAVAAADDGLQALFGSDSRRLAGRRGEVLIRSHAHHMPHALLPVEGVKDRSRITLAFQIGL